MSDFGTLRSLLHDGARDRQTFDRIVRVFVNTLEPQEAERVWLPYALEHLAPWPDASRTLDLDGATTARRGVGPEFALARQLAFDGGWSQELLEEVLKSDAISGVRGVAFKTPFAGPVLEWVATSAPLKGLKRLTAVNLRHPGGLGALAESGLALERLALNACASTDAELEAFADASFMGTLRALSLTSCGVSDRGARALAARPASNMRKLDLSHNAIGADGVRELAHAQGWPTMRTLRLAASGAGDDGLRAFARLGRLHGCVMLNFAECAISDAGVRELVTVGHDGGLDALETLDLSYNSIGREGAGALASLALPSLTHLCMERNALGDGVVDLVRGPGMPRAVYLDFDYNPSVVITGFARTEWPADRSSPHPIEELYLGGVGLDGVAIEQLIGTRRLAGARDITLHGNPFGERGARALNAAAHLNALRYMDLAECELDDDELGMVFAPGGAPWARALTTLDLCDNVLTDASAHVLAASCFEDIRSLVLDSNSIGRGWCEALASSEVFSTLRDLDMNNCDVGDTALEALAESPYLAALESLRLSGCPVSTRGVRALFGGPIMAGLKQLRVNNARVDADTMLALAQTPAATSLETLVVYPMHWGAEVWRRLATSRHLTSLTELTVPYSVDLRRELDVEIRGGARLNPWARTALGRQSA